MRGEEIRVDREALYERVWSVPMSRLAAEYGLSDVGLAKVCKKLNVPRPGLGYWRQLEFGKARRRPPLPPSAVSVAYVTKRENSSIRPTHPREIQSVPMPSESGELHPLVQKTRQALNRARADTYGVLDPREKGLLPIHVRARTRERALRLMDGLLKGLESRGHLIQAGNAQAPANAVSVGGELVSISLFEKIAQSDHVKTKQELADEKSKGWSSAPRFDFTPTGRLVLQIDGLTWTGLRQRWSDGKRQRLEDCLGKFIAGLEAAAAHERDERREREESQRRREEERLREEEQRRIGEHEHALIADLEKQAGDWKKASALRAFLDAVDQLVPTSNRDSEFTAWLGWARGVADELDPFSDPQSIPKPLVPEHRDRSRPSYAYPTHQWPPSAPFQATEASFTIC